MGRCQYWINSQHRCPDRALPGSNFCRCHQRHLRVLTAPTISMSSWEKYRQPTAVPARPGTVGKVPEYPGLFTDHRNILVGKEGIIYLPGPQEMVGEEEKSPQLLLLLTNLSLKLRLAGQVEVYALHKNLGYLVKIIVTEANWEAFSSFYDHLATAAGISHGHLYVGQDPYYICYRDWQAPQGYDAAAGPVAIDTLMLTDKSGQYHLPARDYRRLSLTDLIMLLSPVIEPEAQKMTDVYFSLPRPLYQLVGRYLYNHHLKYRIAGLVDQWGREQVMLHLDDGQFPGSEHEFPRQVLTFLTDLPDCRAFRSLAAMDSRRLLVSWDASLAGKAERLLELFPPDTLLLFSSDPAMGNQCLTPAPVFFDNREQVNFSFTGPPCAGRKSIVHPQKLELSIPLRLTYDKKPARITDALLLDNEEMGWFARLMYRLPSRIFSHCRIFRGQEFSVLLGDGSEEIHVPFGLPLQRVQQGNLLIPRHTRIIPKISWPLLAGVLGLEESQMTILTAERHIAFPLDGFLPLSRSLISGFDPREIKVEVVAPEVLPELHWDFPKTMAAESARMIQGERQGEVVETLESGVKMFDSKVEIALPGEKEIFRKRAESLMQSGDYLEAAVCFSLAEMPQAAARCYRDAALKAEENLQS